MDAKSEEAIMCNITSTEDQPSKSFNMLSEILTSQEEKKKKEKNGGGIKRYEGTCLTAVRQERC